MRRNGVLGLSVLLFATTLCAAGLAAAADGLHLAGAVSTSGGVFVQLNARMNPAGGNQAPATGGFRASGTPWGEMSGTVTCVGSASPNQISIGGRLDSVLTIGGVTAPDFVLLLTTDGREVTNLVVTPADLTLLPDCGLPLFFSSPPLQGRPENDVVQGHIDAH
jgi:hypothetical protein